MKNLITRFLNLEPADIMFRDLFDSDSFFASLLDIDKIRYPVDIKETKNGLEIDIAAVGIDKEDIDITVGENGDVLKVEYQRKDNHEEDSGNYLHRGITRRSFKFAWRISPKFDLKKTEAKLDKGLLKILIPLSESTSHLKKIEIK